MTRKPNKAPPPPEVRALGPEEIERAIAKLGKRLDDVRALDPRTAPPDDQRVENVTRSIVTAILEIYGPNSPQYRDNEHLRIWYGAMGMAMSEYERQQAFASGIPQTATLLEGLISDLEERLSESRQDPAARIQDAFQALDLHPRIGQVVAELYRDRHYRNAILDGSLALVNYVKEKSRRSDLDGAGLMRTVFSRHSPVLAFNDLSDQGQQDEQEGMMHLFEGAVLAFRNPRAHDLGPDSAEYALESIAFLSWLAKRLDQAKLIKP